MNWRKSAYIPEGTASSCDESVMSSSDQNHQSDESLSASSQSSFKSAFCTGAFVSDTDSRQDPVSDATSLLSLFESGAWLTADPSSGCFLVRDLREESLWLLESLSSEVIWLWRQEVDEDDWTGPGTGNATTSLPSAVGVAEMEKRGTRLRRGMWERSFVGRFLQGFSPIGDVSSIADILERGASEESEDCEAEELKWRISVVCVGWRPAWATGIYKRRSCLVCMIRSKFEFFNWKTLIERGL